MQKRDPDLFERIGRKEVRTYCGLTPDQLKNPNFGMSYIRQSNIHELIPETWKINNVKIIKLYVMWDGKSKMHVRDFQVHLAKKRTRLKITNI